MKRAIILALAALAASCATALPQVVPNSDGTFAVRFDQNTMTFEQVDAQARTHCNGAIAQFVSQETRFDGFAYRTYRCPAPQAGPDRVSVLLGPDADATAQRECGGPARPETVTHESNVVIYRCVRST